MPAKRRHDGARFRIPHDDDACVRAPVATSAPGPGFEPVAAPFPTACSSHTASDNTASSCASITRSGRISRAARDEARRRLSSSTGTIHARSVRSRDAVTTVVSRSHGDEGVSARTCHTTSTCPRSVARCAPVATSHILTSASVDADATIADSTSISGSGVRGAPDASGANATRDASTATAPAPPAPNTSAGLAVGEGRPPKGDEGRRVKEDEGGAAGRGAAGLAPERSARASAPARAPPARVPARNTRS